jgi:hypothetical protein
MLRDDIENGAQHQGIAMEYTLTSAAKAVGVHKASIHRAIKSGKLSARRLEDGTYRIDPAELSRVYEVKPPATDRAMAQRDDPHPPVEPPATARDGEAATVIAMLREQLERERETVADLRNTVSRLLLALPAPQRPQDGPSEVVVPPPPAPTPRGFLARLLGRG